MALKGWYLKVSGGKTHYLSYSAQKLKAVHPVKYFPRFLGKNIKKRPPSKLFLFTSMVNTCLLCEILKYINCEHVEFDEGKSQFLPFLVVYQGRIQDM